MIKLWLVQTPACPQAGFVYGARLPRRRLENQKKDTLFRAGILCGRQCFGPLFAPILPKPANLTLGLAEDWHSPDVALWVPNVHRDLEQGLPESGTQNAATPQNLV